MGAHSYEDEDTEPACQPLTPQSPPPPRRTKSRSRGSAPSRSPSPPAARAGRSWSCTGARGPSPWTGSPSCWPAQIRPACSPRCTPASAAPPPPPGFGRPPRPEALTTIAGLAQLYVNLLDQLDLTGVIVVGNSIGGWI